jgi:hypothetical protein
VCERGVCMKIGWASPGRENGGAGERNAPGSSSDLAGWHV